MRLATSIVAAVLASTQIATPAADACGGEYMRLSPAMYLVAEHNGRTFVLLDKGVPHPEAIAWKRETMTYDWSETAPAPAFERAQRLTLVGPKRSRHLASANHVLIKPVFETHDAMNALEIYPRAREEARLAVQGQFKSVVWTDVESIRPSADLIAWAKSPAFSPAPDPNTMSAAKVMGTNIELVTTYTYDKAGHSLPWTYMRADLMQPYGGWGGAPMGVVTLDGTRYLILVNDGLVNPIAI